MASPKEGTEKQIKALKMLREKRGMTQREFSEYMGIPLRTIEDWETGRRKMREYELRLICYYFANSLKDKDINHDVKQDG